MLSISQNTHIENIISEQGDPTPDPRFLELQHSFVMDLGIMGAQFEGPGSLLSHISYLGLLQRHGLFMFPNDPLYKRLLYFRTKNAR